MQHGDAREITSRHACEIADYVRHIRYEQRGTFLLHAHSDTTDAPSNQFTIQYSCPHTHTHTLLWYRTEPSSSWDSWEEGHTSVGKNAEQGRRDKISPSLQERP